MLTLDLEAPSHHLLGVETFCLIGHDFIRVLLRVLPYPTKQDSVYELLQVPRCSRRSKWNRHRREFPCLEYKCKFSLVSFFDSQVAMRAVDLQVSVSDSIEQAVNQLNFQWEGVQYLFLTAIVFNCW